MKVEEICHPINESAATSYGLAEIASFILVSMARKTMQTLSSATIAIVNQPQRKIDAYDFPDGSLSNCAESAVFMKRLRKISPLAAKFVTDISLTVSFNNDCPERGSYTKRYSPEIKLRLDKDTISRITELLKSDHLNFESVQRLFHETRFTLIHELTHAFDDWVSSGKFRINRRSLDAAKSKKDTDIGLGLYFNSPIEINARYVATAAIIRNMLFRDRSLSWSDCLKFFKTEFAAWKLLSSDDKRRLITRLSGEFDSFGMTKKVTDFSSDVKSLEGKLGADVYLDYKVSVGLISIDLPIDQTSLLPIICKFADQKKLELCSSVLNLNAETKALGFIANKGSKHRYDLPFGTKIYREARK